MVQGGTGAPQYRKVTGFHLSPLLPRAHSFHFQDHQFIVQDGCRAPAIVSAVEARSRRKGRRAKKLTSIQFRFLETTFLFISNCPECSHMATSGHPGASDM